MPSDSALAMHRGPALRDVRAEAPFYAACTLLFLGLLLGGIQSAAPVLHFAVEALTLAYLAVFALCAPRFAVPRGQLALALAVLAIPVIQLVPLPYGVWSALPGRGLVVEADRLIGLGDLWRPMTMSVEGTTRALVSLLPPLALFLTVPCFSAERRRQLVMVVLLVATLSLMMSAVQFGSSPGTYRFYRGGHDEVPVGILANRNHQANFMLVCMPLLAAIIRNRLRGREGVQLTVAVVAVFALAAGVLATNSRTGFALLPVATLGAVWVFAAGNPAAAMVAQSRVLKIALAITVVALLGFVIAGTAGVRTLVRFDNIGDLRFENWPLVLELIKAHLPWGSGLGTFDAVFRTAEDLNTVTEKFFNHAHNDYLEVLLETGLLGAVVGSVGIGVLAVQLVRVSARTNPLAFAAGVALVLMLAHSLIDYPLRTYTLSMTFALCAVLLLNPGKSATAGSSSSKTDQEVERV